MLAFVPSSPQSPTGVPVLVGAPRSSWHWGKEQPEMLMVVGSRWEGK